METKNLFIGTLIGASLTTGAFQMNDVDAVEKNITAEDGKIKIETTVPQTTVTELIDVQVIKDKLDGAYIALANAHQKKAVAEKEIAEIEASIAEFQAILNDPDVKHLE